MNRCWKNSAYVGLARPKNAWRRDDSRRSAVPVWLRSCRERHGIETPKNELAKNCDMLLQASACRQPGAKPKKALPGGNIGIPHAISADMARDIGKPGFRTSACRIRVDRIRFRWKPETVQVAESSGGW